MIGGGFLLKPAPFFSLTLTIGSVVFSVTYATLPATGRLTIGNIAGLVTAPTLANSMMTSAVVLTFPTG